MLAVALALTFVFHKTVLGAVVFCLAATVLIGGLFVPVLYYGFKTLGTWLAKAVGIGLTWGLLVPFFYLCFTIGRLFFLAAGKDPMRRKFDPKMTSYWTDRETVTDPESYRRQY